MTDIEDEVKNIKLVPPKDIAKKLAEKESNVIKLPEQHSDMPKFMNVAQLLKNPPQTHWCIKNYFPARGMIFLAGEASACKTFLMINICYHIAHGIPWCGNKTTPGWVLYINGEGNEEFKKRLKGIGCEQGQDFPDDSLVVSQSPVMINNPGVYSHVRKVIDVETEAHGKPPALIVVDTKAANMEGSDSDIAVMSNWINQVRMLQNDLSCLVLIVDHVGHTEKGRLRGASQQIGAADAVYLITKYENKEGDEIIELASAKPPKDYKEPGKVIFKKKVVELPEDWAEVDEDGEVETQSTLVLEHVPKSESELELDSKANALSTQASRILNRIETWWQDAERNLGGLPAMSVESQALLKDLKESDAMTQSFISKVLGEFEHNGLITRLGTKDRFIVPMRCVDSLQFAKVKAVLDGGA